VVEDEVLIRTLLAEILREEGAAVIETATADEAWSFLVAGGEVDLIVSDLQMPGSISGLQLVQRIRDQGCRCR
jgi:CheY-like chemotaxis protein